MRSKDPPHHVAGILPNPEEDALALMIARAVLMWSAKVADANRAVDGTHDFSEGDLGRIASENISTPNATFRADEASPLQSKENLFEVRLRECRARGDVACALRSQIIGMQSQ